MKKFSSKKSELRNIMYNESHSRVPIKNMCYKDNAPFFITIIGDCDKDINNSILKSIDSNFQSNNQNINTFTSGRNRFSIYNCSEEFNDIIDSIKISDIIIFVIKEKLEKSIFEYINIINATGVGKILFYRKDYKSDNKNKSMNNTEIIKRLSKEFTYKIQLIKNIDFLIKELKTIKIRPIEFKCANSHIVVDKIRNGKIFGYLRGAPLPICNNSSELNIPSIPCYMPSFGYINENIKNITKLKDPTGDGFKGVFNEGIGEEEVEHSDEIIDDKSEEFEIFKDGNMKIDYSSNNDSDNDSNNDSSSNLSDEANINISNEDSKPSLENNVSLKEKLAHRFSKKDDFIDDKIFDKKEEIQISEKEILSNDSKKYKEISNSIIPGEFVEIELDNGLFDKISEKFLNGILILGFYNDACKNDSLQNLNDFNAVLEGNFTKNCFYKDDFKNTFVSIGWHRHSTPIFFVNAENFISDSFENNLIFLSANLSNSFFLYNPSSFYRIIGKGSVIGINKQYYSYLSLIGSITSVKGLNSIVSGMFNSSKEVDKFISGKIKCKNGIRGLIKSSIGKNGDFRAKFEGEVRVGDEAEFRLKVKCDIFGDLNNIRRNDKCLKFERLGNKKINSENDNLNQPFQSETISKLDKKIQDLKEKIKEKNLSVEKKIYKSANNLILDEKIDKRKKNALEHMKKNKKFKR